MNRPSETAEITGYTPPTVDLTPFRAGMVWHYRNVAYLVTGTQFRESVGQRVERYLTGKPAHGEVGPDGRTEVAMRLERADWLDALPTRPRWQSGRSIATTSGATRRASGG